MSTEEVKEEVKEDSRTPEQIKLDEDVSTIVGKFQELRKSAVALGLDLFVITNLGGQAVLPIDLFPIVVHPIDSYRAPQWMINMSFDTMKKVKAEQPRIIVPGVGGPVVDKGMVRASR